MAWHQKLIAKKYDGAAQRGPGRPPIASEVEALVVRMAEEDRDRGYRRIQGALSNLGHSIGRSTIAAVLQRMGSNQRRSEAGRRPGRSFNVKTGVRRPP